MFQQRTSMTAVVRTIQLISLVLLATFAAEAQCGLNKDYKKGRFPSIEKGEPPPGDSLNIPAGVARVTIRTLLQKRHPLMLPDKFLLPGATFYESKAIKTGVSGFSFDFDTSANSSPTKSRETHHTNFVFGELDYVIYGPLDVTEPVSCVAAFSKEFRKAAGNLIFPWYVLTWKDEADAKRFAGAFNRLVYEARNPSSTTTEFADFAAKARSWRESPSSRQQPPAEWDRHRVLAEAAIREKDFLLALQNYENALSIFPTWPEGWFNAALLYGEMGEPALAADRMKHYLELMPDASDARAAREKVIVWEDKAKVQK